MPDDDTYPETSNIETIGTVNCGGQLVRILEACHEEKERAEDYEADMQSVTQDAPNRERAQEVRGVSLLRRLFRWID